MSANPNLNPPPAAPPPPRQPSAHLAALKIERSKTGRPAHRGGGRWLVWALLLLALVGALLAWWRMPRTLAVRTLTVVSTTPSQQFIQMTASGFVVAQSRASVSSKATGRVVALNVQEGSRVKRGDLIAQIDAGDVRASLQASQAALAQARARLRQSEAELASAEAELKRTVDMERDGYLSSQALEQVRSRVTTARAAVDAVRADTSAAQAQISLQEVNLSYADVRAPIDGVVLTRNANLGDVVSPLAGNAGMPGSLGSIVTLADLSTLVVEADVSESQLSKVRVGQPVEVALDALPAARFRGTVQGVLPAVDRARSTVKVRIGFAQIDPQLMPDMSAKVNFLSRPVEESEQRPVLAVAPAAIANREGGARVFRVRTDNGVASVESLPVKVGRKLGALVEVSSLAALQAGDRLVAAPSFELRDGQVVNPSGN